MRIDLHTCPVPVQMWLDKPRCQNRKSPRTRSSKAALRGLWAIAVMAALPRLTPGGCAFASIPAPLQRTWAVHVFPAGAAAQQRSNTTAARHTEKGRALHRGRPRQAELGRERVLPTRTGVERRTRQPALGSGLSGIGAKWESPRRALCGRRARQPAAAACASVRRHWTKAPCPRDSAAARSPRRNRRARCRRT